MQYVLATMDLTGVSNPDLQSRERGLGFSNHEFNRASNCADVEYLDKSVLVIINLTEVSNGYQLRGCPF